jgi:hypothetical protein
MAEKVQRLEDRPLSARRAMERIRTLWRNGQVEILPHAQGRMRERKIDVPISNMSFDMGTSVDNERVACVVEINGNLIIVTVVA